LSNSGDGDGQFARARSFTANIASLKGTSMGPTFESIGERGCMVHGECLSIEGIAAAYRSRGGSIGFRRVLGFAPNDFITRLALGRSIPRTG
jgi:hypothetical protein